MIGWAMRFLPLHGDESLLGRADRLHPLGGAPWVPRDKRAAIDVRIACPTRGMEPQESSLDSQTRHMCQRAWPTCPKRQGLDSPEPAKQPNHQLKEYR